MNNRDLTLDACLARWYAYIRSHDDTTLSAMLHPDAVFESPVVHTPQRGRDIVLRYLSAAEAVLGGPAFAYRGEWRSERGAVLEFVAEIDGIAVNGVDIIGWDDCGLIVHFKVMVRPLKAVNAVHARMAATLAAG